MERADDPHSSDTIGPAIVAKLIRRTGVCPSVALRMVRMREAEGLTSPADLVTLALHAEAMERRAAALRTRRPVAPKPSRRRAPR